MSDLDAPVPEFEASDALAVLVTALVDGKATAVQHAGLARVLATDPLARKWFIDYMQLHASLTWNADDLADTSDEVEFPDQFSTAPAFLSTTFHGTVNYFSSGWPLAYLITTVIFTVGLLVGFFTPASTPSAPTQIAAQPGQQEPPIVNPKKEAIVGRIVDMVDCKWSRGQGAAGRNLKNEAVGQKSLVALGDKFILASGLVEIAYDTGAKVLLQGPVTYQVDSPRGGFLSVGKMTARVDKKAGKQIANPQFRIPNPPLFTVRTPTAVVNDLGTEFGMDVDRNGLTQSHCFLGRIEFVALDEGRKQVGENVVLRENQSACTERRNDIDGRIKLCVAVDRSKTTQEKIATRFVRRIPANKSKFTIRLADILSGGDGTGWQKEHGINCLTGLREGNALSYEGTESVFGDGQYHRTKQFSFVDGVFVPFASRGPTTLDSAGHAFRFPTANGKTWGAFWPTSLRLMDPDDMQAVIGGVDYDTLGHTLIIARANKGITFDLAAIRKAYPNHRIVKFRAVVGNIEAARVKAYMERRKQPINPITIPHYAADYWVFVDGVKRAAQLKFYTSDGAMPVDVSVTEADRFLTLVATDGGDGDWYDVVVFGDPELVCEEK